jgi:hypothetical protein
MSHTPPPGQDLDALIARAQSEARDLHSPQVAPPRKPGRRWMLLVLAGAALAVALHHALPRLRSAPDEVMRAGLVLVAEDARREIESWRQERGDLPRALPSPVLGSLVVYRPSGNGYRLQVTDGRLSIEMDEAGVVIDR